MSAIYREKARLLLSTLCTLATWKRESTNAQQHLQEELGLVLQDLDGEDDVAKEASRSIAAASELVILANGEFERQRHEAGKMIAYAIKRLHPDVRLPPWLSIADPERK